jgi:cell division protein FtsL
LPAYMHGNLAVEQRPEQKPKVQETKKVVYRRKTLPLQEKLLYLFTVAICVVVAGVIIFRYAQIYEMSAQIKTIEQQITRLESENSILKQKLDAAMEPHRMLQQAKELGFNTAEPNQVKSNTDKAANGKSTDTKSTANAKKTKDQP